MFDTATTLRTEDQGRADGERGMATAEYAVGTTGAFCIGCLLFKMGVLGADDWLVDIFKQLGAIGGSGFLGLLDFMRWAPRL